MEFKLTSDISQSVLCPESFVAFEFPWIAPLPTSRQIASLQC